MSGPHKARSCSYVAACHRGYIATHVAYHVALYYDYELSRRWMDTRGNWHISELGRKEGRKGVRKGCVGLAAKHC